MAFSYRSNMSSSDRNASGTDNEQRRSRGSQLSRKTSGQMRTAQDKPRDDHISPYGLPSGPQSMIVGPSLFPPTTSTPPNSNQPLTQYLQRRSDGETIPLFDLRKIPFNRITAAQESWLFAMPPLPSNAMTPLELQYSQILINPPPNAFRRNGSITRTWLGASMPGEFRKNNSCLKGAQGSISHMGAAKLNLSPYYWDWLAARTAPPTHATGGPLARRRVLCDEQHNRDNHSSDRAHFVCPFPHALANARWDHGYEHLVCAACEEAQPHACAPLVRMVLTEGPLVAMCEACALWALDEYGPGYNGCECTAGAFGGLCLQHQNEEAERLARRWIAYRAQHNGPGGWDEDEGAHIVVPYCRCDRVPVPRSLRPFAFWCAACEKPVILPKGKGWRKALGGGDMEKKPQRWLVPANLPVADFDAEWTRDPSQAPPYRRGGPVVDPDRFRSDQRQRQPAIGSDHAPPPRPLPQPAAPNKNRDAGMGPPPPPRQPRRLGSVAPAGPKRSYNISSDNLGDD